MMIMMMMMMIGTWGRKRYIPVSAGRPVESSPLAKNHTSYYRTVQKQRKEIGNSRLVSVPGRTDWCNDSDFFSFSFLFLFWGTYCLEMVGVR